MHGAGQLPQHIPVLEGPRRRPMGGQDPSPARFYSDPKMHQQRLVCERASLEGFLQAFNTQPMNARLRIVGRLPGEESLLGSFLQSLQIWCRSWVLPERSPLPSRLSWDPVLFDVSLDLTPFISGEGRLASQADVVALEQHLVAPNPLEVVVLRKRVEWQSWQDVATNIRQRFRALGFPGEVEVQFQAEEELVVFRNDPWQNFVRSRVTQAVVVMSVVGILVWMPYVWLRSRRVKVDLRYRVSLDLQRYWEMLSEGLSASEGFQGAVSGR
ncbi:unnamed protein product [Prorocentrum cordatum]|uniref:Transmembrane protein 231 n=1 Tax=Prorocentrum cordatum TaxID=2364126 RepID=A0ABN9T519_9DINO|nr:unnamed protein product [Polarella glacialis]